jgi:asparagine synthase (glutamine-hydrolysing)
MSSPRRYWQPQFAVDEKLSAQDAIQRVEAAIDDSVRAHLIADVPVGIFLSGGLDSSIVAATVRQHAGASMAAFTIAFDDSPASEHHIAAEIARALGFEHHVERVTPDALGLLPELLSHCGEPFGDSSILPTYLVSRLARHHVPVALSGDGGDEAFGGYASHMAWADAGSVSRLIGGIATRPRSALFWARRLKWLMPTSSRADQWLRFVEYSTPQLRRSLWRPEYRNVVQERVPEFQEAAARIGNTGRLAFAQAMDYNTYLPDDVLTKVDIASMAHGLEVRPPLIDLEVFSAAASLPSSLRVGKPGSRTGKVILQNIARTKLPTIDLNRPKQGFAVPRAKWFAPGSPVASRLEQLIHDEPRMRAWFDTDSIVRMLRTQSATRDRSPMLWLLLVLGTWLDMEQRVSFD